MTSDRAAPDGNGNGIGGDERVRLRRFLHCGHVFSSAVNEILESKYLAEASPYPLTVPQLRLLKLVTLQGRHQVGAVAELLGVSAPAASKSIGKLEGLGLVSRTSSQGDRRVTLLTASEEGHRVVQAYEGLKAARLAPVLDGFEPAEIDQLVGLLERFSIGLLQAEKTGSNCCLRCSAYGNAGCALVEVDGTCPYARGGEHGPGES